MVVLDVLEDNSHKQLIFETLSMNSPMKARIIHNFLKRQYGLGSSYQSTFKVLNDLVGKRILVKDNLQYRLNFEWLIKQKSQLDRLISNAGTAANQVFLSNSMKVLVLENLKELDNCIQTHVLLLNQKLQAPRTYWKSPHCWWLVGYPIEEEELVKEYRKNNLKTSVLIGGTSDHDHLAKQYYETKKDDVIVEKSRDREVVQVIGDYVLRCELPQSIMEQLDEIYKIEKNRDMLSRMLAAISHKEKFELQIIKNPQLAKVYVDQIVKC